MKHGYSLVDKQFFVPEKWFADNYRHRRKKCKLPEDNVFRTKPQMALKMVEAIVAENVLPFKYMLTDSLYGISPEFVQALEALTEKTYFVSVPKDTLCWLKRPMAITRECLWGEKTRTKTVLLDPSSKPISVEELAGYINDNFWYRLKVSEGTKSPIVYEHTRRRIILSPGIHIEMFGC